MSSPFYPSLEVRWFFPGSLPVSVVSWFADASTDPPARRTDQYLRLPGHDELGIKLREGKFETKKRAGRLGVRQFGADAWGRVEQWRKWSFRLAPETGPIDTLAAPPEAWLAVEKHRRLRTYRIEDGRPVVHPTGEFLERGCGVEVTDVRVEGASWWTLGFEAFGPEADIEDTFETVVAHVFRDPPPAALPVGASYGYPCWFLRLANATEPDPCYPEAA